MREALVRVVDHESYQGNKTSKMITRKEHKMIYPDLEALRLSFIFIHDRESLIPEKQAKFLRRKFGAVIEILGQENTKVVALDDLEGLKRPALVNLAARLDIYTPMKLKNPALIDAIKEAMGEGKQPLSQSEFKKRKQSNKEPVGV